MVVTDAAEFLRARGHRVDELTDYELHDAFDAAFKNWQHGLVESAFYNGLPWVAKPRDWKRYCDELHNAIEGKPGAHSTTSRMLTHFLSQGVPVIH